jgi:hypothetical protein
MVEITEWALTGERGVPSTLTGWKDAGATGQRRHLAHGLATAKARTFVPFTDILVKSDPRRRRRLLRCRGGERDLAERFRWRALVAGVVAGALALGGIGVLRADAPRPYQGLTGRALPLIVASAAFGLASLALMLARRFTAVRHRRLPWAFELGPRARGATDHPPRKEQPTPRLLGPAPCTTTLLWPCSTTCSASGRAAAAPARDPYGHRLLAIDAQRSQALREEVGRGGCEAVKPG